jgi:hypothetical protein
MNSPNDGNRRIERRRSTGAAGSMLLVVGFLWSIAGNGVSHPALAAEPLVVAGFSFARPDGWIRQEAASAMRAAQFVVPSGSRGNDGIVIFFRFPPGIGGTAERNIARWLSQFKEPEETLNAVVETASKESRRFHYFRAAGTLIGRDGEMPDYALHAAVLDGPAGRVFVRFVAPNSVASVNEAAFRKLVDDAFESGHER